MRFSKFLPLALAGSVQSLNILLNNDDGFASGNLREVYKLLKAAGHNAWIVAPVINQSGSGGVSNFADTANLTTSSQYGIIPAGAPSIGSDPHDSHIWYYNGTPAACTFVALDYVFPRYADFKVPDLVLTGPNYGTNLGPFVWTLSGTAGAAYAATERSIPAIAFSASNAAVDYRDVKNSTHPAAVVAKMSVKVVEEFIKTSPKGGPLLPLGYGLTVNIPPLNATGPEPKIVRTRMTGNAQVNEAAWNATKGTFTWANLKPYAAGINQCVHGDCKLPGETYVVENGGISVSIYTVDYTAPANEYSSSIMNRLEPMTKW